jgi:hypothetical protein
MCGGGGSDPYAAQSRADEVARQERIKSGMSQIDQRFAGFNDDFFKKRSEEFMNVMNPQAVKQYRQANEGLAYSLARNGLTDSSERAKSEGILKGQLDTARSEIANQSIDRTNEQRQAVEQGKTSLIQQLNATADSNAVASQALNSANRLAGQQSYSLLGNMFANTTGLVSDAKTAGMYDRNAVGAKPIYNFLGLGGGKEKVTKTD